MSTNTRFRVSALVGDKIVTHLIRAKDQDAAERRFSSAYRGANLVGLRVMTPDEVKAEQARQLAAIKAARAADRQGKFAPGNIAVSPANSAA